MVIVECRTAPDEEYRIEPIRNAVEKAYGLVPDRWKTLLPELKVVPTTLPFPELEEVRHYEEAFGGVGDWAGVVTCAIARHDGTQIVFAGGDKPVDMFVLTKSFLLDVSRVLWIVNDPLRKLVVREAKRIDRTCTVEEAFLVFQNAFVLHWVAPRCLNDRLPDQSALIRSIDRSVRLGLASSRR